MNPDRTADTQTELCSDMDQNSDSDVSSLCAEFQPGRVDFYRNKLKPAEGINVSALKRGTWTVTCRFISPVQTDVLSAARAVYLCSSSRHLTAQQLWDQTSAQNNTVRSSCSEVPLSHTLHSKHQNFNTKTARPAPHTRTHTHTHTHTRTHTHFWMTHSYICQTDALILF